MFVRYFQQQKQANFLFLLYQNSYLDKLRYIHDHKCLFLPYRVSKATKKDKANAKVKKIPSYHDFFLLIFISKLSIYELIKLHANCL